MAKSKTIKTDKTIFALLGFLKWFIVIFFTIYTLFPLLWLFITSLKTNAEYFASPFSFPSVPQFSNYYNAFKQANLGQMTYNSIVVSLVATFMNILIAALVAYPLSRFKFKGRNLIFMLFSAGILVPLNALMVPYYVIFNKIGLLDNLNSLRLLYASIGLPISIFIIRGFMSSLPVEIEQSALIDGCGFYRRFFRIILPLSKTGLVTAATFQFLTCWNEFVYANLLIMSPEKKTIQLGVRYFTNQFMTDYVSLYAAIVIAIIPSVLGFVLFQRHITSGLTSGAMKG